MIIEIRLFPLRTILFVTNLVLLLHFGNSSVADGHMNSRALNLKIASMPPRFYFGKALAHALVAPALFISTLSPLSMPPMPAAAEVLESASSVMASAASSSSFPLPKVYFGVGCFWHVQHEFVEAEKSFLGRTNDQITSIAGYAGGSKVGNDGTVCYHNMLGKSEYGALGHGEVVGLDLPESKMTEFSRMYFSLFKDGNRPDKGDRGPEYRSIVGLPGGSNSVYYGPLKAAAAQAGLRLEDAQGNDPDTLNRKLVYVYDSEKFPFHAAEVYHQFHDGFMMGEQYPESYNSIVNIAKQRGLVQRTGCPDV